MVGSVRTAQDRLALVNFLSFCFAFSGRFDVLFRLCQRQKARCIVCGPLVVVLCLLWLGRNTMWRFLCLFTLPVFGMHRCFMVVCLFFCRPGMVSVFGLVAKAPGVQLPAADGRGRIAVAREPFGVDAISHSVLVRQRGWR